MREVAKGLRKIHRQQTEDSAKDKFEEFKGAWSSKYPQVANELERDWEVITTFYRYPYEVRRSMSTTNLIKSVHSKIKKVSDSRL